MGSRNGGREGPGFLSKQNFLRLETHPPPPNRAVCTWDTGSRPRWTRGSALMPWTAISVGGTLLSASETPRLPQRGGCSTSRPQQAPCAHRPGRSGLQGGPEGRGGVGTGALSPSGSPSGSRRPQDPPLPRPCQPPGEPTPGQPEQAAVRGGEGSSLGRPAPPLPRGLEGGVSVFGGRAGGSTAGPQIPKPRAGATMLVCTQGWPCCRGARRMGF